MSFFKDLGDADSKHLATILLVPLLLLPGFQEKLFIENVPFAELDVLRLLAYAAVIGFTLLLVNGGIWMWTISMTDPEDPENLFLLETVFNGMLTCSIVSTLLIGVDFLMELNMSAREYFLGLFVGSVLVSIVGLFVFGLPEKRKKTPKK